MKWPIRFAGGPLVRAITNDSTAYLGRICHPLRMQRWGFSDLNPLLWPAPALASAVNQSRSPASKDNPFRKAENTFSRTMSASLDLYRDMRDAWSEMLFFQIYAPMIIFGVVENTKDFAFQKTASPRDLPFVKEALAAIERGRVCRSIGENRGTAGVGTEAEYPCIVWNVPTNGSKKISCFQACRCRTMMSGESGQSRRLL